MEIDMNLHTNKNMREFMIINMKVVNKETPLLPNPNME
jgi:hypothetical protein